jgi:hypothetical protein
MIPKHIRQQLKRAKTPETLKQFPDFQFLDGKM